jgi:hypothetical protein
VNVVKLQQYRSRDVERALRCLLAKWEAGKVKGVALCFKDDDGVEHISFTGNYRDDPAHALSAALKMSRRINEIQDEQDGRIGP